MRLPRAATAGGSRGNALSNFSVWSEAPRGIFFVACRLKLVINCYAVFSGVQDSWLATVLRAFGTRNLEAFFIFEADR